MSTDPTWAREQVLDRFKFHNTPSGFLHPARVEAALQLQREGRLICWRETQGATEILVCKLRTDVPRSTPPFGGLIA